MKKRPKSLEEFIGGGVTPEDEYETCWNCSGRGFLYTKDPDTGKDKVEVCEVCHGKGRIKKDEDGE